MPYFSRSSSFPRYVEMLCPTATQEPIGISPSKRGNVDSKSSKSISVGSVISLASKTGTFLKN